MGIYITCGIYRVVLFRNLFYGNVIMDLQQRNVIDYERRIRKSAHKGSKSAKIKLQQIGLLDYVHGQDEGVRG